MAWSPALAGLRGLAILLVVVSHLGLPAAGGGLVGVTVFFVLSGFLITSLLATEIGQTGRVDLWAFGVRRFRRLMPALMVAVVVVLSLAAIVGRGPEVLEDSLPTLTYSANWARAGGDGMGIWNHAWSLAIEGQFYVLWPIAMLGIARYVGLTSGRAMAFLMILAAASAVLRIGLAWAGTPGDRSYFGTDTRAEALVIGGVVALLLARGPDRRVPAWAGAVGLATIAVLALFPNPDLGWPGSTYSAVAVATAVLIVAVMTGDRGFGLPSRPMTWLGERSYSLYLWHVPVIVLIGPFQGQGAIPGIAAAVATMLVLSELSYRYVESPFRRSRASARPGACPTAPRSQVPPPQAPVPEGA